MDPPLTPRIPAIQPIAAPAKPSAPAVFADCLSDDAALIKVPLRRTTGAAFNVKPQMDWYPGSPASTAGNQVIPYVYGTCAFADMADALLTAFSSEHRVYLLGWSTDKGTPLKSGPNATLEDYLVKTRAHVRGMFYSGLIRLPIPAGATIRSPDLDNTWIDQAVNGAVHGASVIDSRLPVFGIHHQKLLVVQGAFGIVAFIGGMDFSSKRVEVNPGSGLPYHDTQIRLTGPAAIECRRVFEDRWLDHPATPALDRRLGLAAGSDPAARRAFAFPSPAALSLDDLPSGTIPSTSPRRHRRVRVAIGRTFGKATYSFAPSGDYGVWSLLQKAIAQARRWIYIEDQYLVSRMARKLLVAKLRDTPLKYLLMVMNGSDAAATDIPFLVTARNEFRRDLLAVDPKKTRWGMYTLTTPAAPERQKWCGSYLHSKTWVFDDSYVILGSANCDDRGYTLDTEVVAGIADADESDVRLGRGFATEVRTALWHKHLGVAHAQIRDWDQGIGYWKSPPPSAMIQDATALEIDNRLSPPAQFPSASSAATVDQLWTNIIDPDAR